MFAAFAQWNLHAGAERLEHGDFAFAELAVEAECEHAVADGEVGDLGGCVGDGEDWVYGRVEQVADDGGGFVTGFAADDEERRRRCVGEHGEDEPIFEVERFGFLEVERQFEIAFELGGGFARNGQGAVGGGAHAPNEWVSLSAIEQRSDFLRAFIKDLLS